MAGMAHELTITGSRGAPTAIQAVVFDFDDTLADTLAARVHAWGQTFAWAGIEKPSAADFVTEQRGVSLQGSVEILQKSRGVNTEGMLEAYRSAYWAKKPGLLRLFDGVQELVSTLRDAGVPMGIVTSKGRDLLIDGRAAGTLVELDELGLSWLAPHTVGFEDVSHPKPHPEGVLRVLDGLGVTPEVTLVVGDSPADILAAHNAGCWSALAGWGVPLDQREMAKATPDVVAENPSALGVLLGEPPWANG
jgi:phosphoglycolate phosphatase-like HAD superfamily hydrolase